VRDLRRELDGDVFCTILVGRREVCDLISIDLIPLIMNESLDMSHDE
jgi:hypothetical protein